MTETSGHTSCVGVLALLTSCIGLSFGPEIAVAAEILFFSEAASAQASCSSSTTVALLSSTASEFKSGTYTNVNSATTLTAAISTAETFLSNPPPGCIAPIFTVVLPQGYFRVSNYSNGTMATTQNLAVIDVSGMVPVNAITGSNSGTLVIQGQGRNEFTSAYTVLITDNDKLTIFGSKNSKGALNNPGPSNHVTFSSIHFARQNQTVSQGTIVTGGLTSTSVTLAIDAGYPSPGSPSFYDTLTTQPRYLREYTANAGSDPFNTPHLIPSIGFPVSTSGTNFGSSPLYTNDKVGWQGSPMSGAVLPTCSGTTSLICTLYLTGTFATPSWTPGSSLICIKSKNSAIDNDSAYFLQGNDITFNNIDWTERSRLEFDTVTDVNVTNVGIRRRYFSYETALPCLSTPDGGPQINHSTATITGFGAVATGDDSIAFSNNSVGTVTNVNSAEGFARGIYIYDRHVYLNTDSVSATPSANGMSAGNSITTVITTVPGSTTLYNDFLECSTSPTLGGVCPVSNYPY